MLKPFNKLSITLLHTSKESLLQYIIALVVSEETGRLSIAVDSELKYNLSLDEFRMTLVEELKPKTEMFYNADESAGEDNE